MAMRRSAKGRRPELPLRLFGLFILAAIVAPAYSAEPPEQREAEPADAGVKAALRRNAALHKTYCNKAAKLKVKDRAAVERKLLPRYKESAKEVAKQRQSVRSTEHVLADLQALAERHRVDAKRLRFTAERAGELGRTYARNADVRERAAEQMDKRAAKLRKDLDAKRASYEKVAGEKAQLAAAVKKARAAVPARERQRKDRIRLVHDLHRCALVAGEKLTDEQMTKNYKAALTLRRPKPKPRRGRRPPPPPDDILWKLNGKSSIVAADGTYLGKIGSDSMDAKSILNVNGAHGCREETACILNEKGDYGSAGSPTSAFNPDAETPPKVYIGEKFIGFLTTNKNEPRRIDPNALVGAFKGE